MPLKPRLADVRCSRIVFQPGDRVLCRVYHNLDQDQKKKLRKTIQKWAGAEVEVLIYNATAMEITVEKAR